MNFKRAFCTNTRLMGAMMMAVEWESDISGIEAHVFLLDSEGLGIYDFFVKKDASDRELSDFYINKSSCFGGENIELEEVEALSLFAHFYDKNIRNEKEIPENLTEKMYDFYIEKLKKCSNSNNIDDNNDGSDSNDVSCFDFAKVKSLSVMFNKLCKKIDSEYEFVNYMVMRFIARDREALLSFSGSDLLSNQHITEINGTFLYNHVNRKSDDRYICSTVYEDIDGYYETKLIIVIEKNVDMYNLLSIIITFNNPISEEDVFELISKREAISVFNILDENFSVDDLDIFDKIDNMITNLYKSIQRLEYENGVLYTQYWSDNSHVDNEIYVINNDIQFLIYVDDERLYLATYDYETQIFVENLLKSILENIVEFDGVYEFDQNVLFDFIQSGEIDLIF
ncbi:hypothetical protein FYJ71_04570 [Peptostreptococcus anaerobius]|uniref:Uncharacterized protein n=1 Tax=Peptostreptococcus porci TaxID=2652282 RepID=A0A6N7WZM3_9FIRM|nr:hypothetical protein [Peptostreptococcus porci]MDD7182488.1 hypothetical protein [Peptostreptococcus porci]MST62248.1 hypothetical protein [Peptostreptococcus porci]